MTATATAPAFEYTIRPAGADDQRFILETSAKVRQPRRVPWSAWEPVGLRNARQELEAGRALVVDASGVLLGFVVFGESVDMLYVKREFRGYHLGLALMAATGLIRRGQQVLARAPTGCWRRWAAYHGVNWRAA